MICAGRSNGGCFHRQRGRASRVSRDYLSKEGVRWDSRPSAILLTAEAADSFIRRDAETRRGGRSIIAAAVSIRPC